MNMAFNETLPVVSDEVLGGGVQAIVVSTALIIVFGAHRYLAPSLTLSQPRSFVRLALPQVFD